MILDTRYKTAEGDSMVVSITSILYCARESALEKVARGRGKRLDVYMHREACRLLLHVSISCLLTYPITHVTLPACLHVVYPGPLPSGPIAPT
jgi:hypothetical protein